MNGGEYYTKHCPKCSRRLFVNEAWRFAECDCGAELRVSMQLNCEGSSYMVLEVIEEDEAKEGGGNG